MREENVTSLKCKLRLARRRIRELDQKIKMLQDELKFRNRALIRSTLIIEKLDQEGKLWKALMSPGATP